MTQWNMIIDVGKCGDCNNCFLACKDEYLDNDFPPHSAAQPRHGHRWINIMRKERGAFPMVDVAYLPMPCMHCDDARCVAAARNGAAYKRSDGIVIIDPIKAKGQRELVDACPYGAVWWNPERGLPQKCSFCVHLLEEGWKEPRCVQACPTGAMRVLRAEAGEMQRIAEAEGLRVLGPEHGTRPRVYYKDLDRYDRCFVAGSVAVEIDGATNCLEGAKVTLTRASEKLAEASTDSFGDFKFDGLEQASGRYSMRIEHPNCETRTVEVDLETSVSIGTLWLAGAALPESPILRTES